jgi:hypothetical protein
MPFSKRNYLENSLGKRNSGKRNSGKKNYLELKSNPSPGFLCMIIRTGPDTENYYYRICELIKHGRNIFVAVDL